MRVAVVLEQCLSPVPGGTGRYSREVARAVAAQPDVTVTGWTAWHRDVGPATVPGVSQVRRLPLPRRPLIAAWERGHGPAPRDADVVHAPTLLAPPRRTTPLVVTIHDAVPWTHPETLTPRGVAWHRRMAERAEAAADAVIVPTAAVAAELRGVLDLGDRLHVVGEGVTADLALPPDAADRERRLGLPDRYLLTLATLEPRKGLDVALAALADPATGDLPLLVVGQAGWGGVDPVAEATRLGLRPDRVRVLGRLPDADLAVVLGRAAALLVPSRSEGFGLPLLEAMAAGVPVISSDAPALVEVGGGAQRVTPVGDARALAEAIRELVGDERLTSELVAAGRRRAAEFSWETAARQLVAVYRDVARSRV